MHSLVAAVALVVLWAPGAHAQEERQHSLADTATVVGVEPGRSLTVREDDGGRERIVAVDDRTVVRRGSEEIPLTQIAAGDRVVISARREGAEPSDRPIADVVQVVVEEGGGRGATPAVGAGAPSGASEMRVAMRGAEGEDHGELRVQDTHTGLLLRLSLKGLPPGTHGFHVHAVGRCEPPFDSAGDHFSPEGRSHGFLAPGGPHAGDLVNLHVAAGGTVEQEMIAPDLRLADLLDADGAAFIVHERADDFSSQPSGDAGGRISCGAIQRNQQPDATMPSPGS